MSKRQIKAIVALDFDDTIANSNYPSIDSLKSFAKESIQKLYDNGCYIIIWTCRHGDLLTRAINFLIENEIPFDRVNDNEPSLCEIYNNNTRKVSADFYVDDKDWMIQDRFPDYPNWQVICSSILKKIEEHNFVSILNKHKK